MDRAAARITQIWMDGSAIVGIPITALDNFLKYVSTPRDSECWIWTGAKYANGAGDYTWQTATSPKNARTHRIMYQLFKKRKVPVRIPIVQTCGSVLCFR